MIQLSDLLAATAGRLHGPVGAARFAAFCFDSRLVQPGQLFIAVKTERRDGHAFIADALRGGATGVLCETPIDISDTTATCIVVPDTRLAIQQWVQYILAQQGVAVIGVTGSVGKTTTKEAIAAVLDGETPIFKNRANYNGLYGLPIALGELGPQHHLAVLELAADHAGEITRLCALTRPKVGVVTTVEPAHLETFGDLDAIAREKGELIAALPGDGLAVLNADDPRVAAMAGRSAAPVMRYGTDRNTTAGCCDIYASDIIVTREGVHFFVDTPVGRSHVHLPLLGRHQVYAALAAIAVGSHRGIALETLIERLATLPRLPGRLNPLPGRRGSLILDDSYSASPAAVEAALATLAALEARRRVAVLGDMLELGDYEATGHAQVGRRAAGTVDRLVTRGNRARLMADAARVAGLPADQVVATYTAEDAAEAVLDGLGPGDVVLVKGSLATRMEQVTRLLMAEPDQAADQLVRQDAAWQKIVTVRPDRPTWLEIDLGAIAGNVRRLKEMAGPAQILISLKADAYGHGAVQVAQTALLNGATWLGVACLSEGVALRRAGIAAPILVLGYTPAWQARDVLRHELTATVFDLDTATAFSRAAQALDKTARLHVKVDTGMGRLGVFPAETLEFVRSVGALPQVAVEGLFTHLSVADGDSDWEEAYTANQLAQFDELVVALARAGMSPRVIHAANSAGLLRFPHPDPLPVGEGRGVVAVGAGRGEGGHTLYRTGIAVYGLRPSPAVALPEGFRPALAWKTQVAQVKDFPAGSYVGYGATYRTAGTERIAVIPVGYADGFRRAPQHWGEVLVRGQRAPIVGRVCMDQTMINVTDIEGARQGDEVVLIGAQGDDCITAEAIAARLGTISYEVVSGILARVPRETPA